MTFLRSSDVKNHLYTGSGQKKQLITADIDPTSVNQTAPPTSQGMVVAVNKHPTILIGAPIPTAPTGTAAEGQNDSNSSLHLISKVAKAA